MRSTLREVTSDRPSDAARFVRSRDGLDLRTYWWPAVGTARAHVLLVHGIAEHAGRYPRVVSQLPGAGIAIHTYDQRGFGRSGGHRAYVDRWSQYHDDVEDRLAEVRSAADGLPVVVYGHSMGGLIALGYVLADPPRPLPDLLVLSAPAIDAVVRASGQRPTARAGPGPEGARARWTAACPNVRSARRGRSGHPRMGYPIAGGTRERDASRVPRPPSRDAQRAERRGGDRRHDRLDRGPAHTVMTTFARAWPASR